MARGLFFVILAVCLFYISQASPVPNQGAAPTTGNETVDVFASLQTAVNAALEAGKKGWDAVTTDPGVQRVIEDGKKNVQIGLEMMNREIQKLLPATNQS